MVSMEFPLIVYGTIRKSTYVRLYAYKYSTARTNPPKCRIVGRSKKKPRRGAAGSGVKRMLFSLHDVLYPYGLRVVYDDFVTAEFAACVSPERVVAVKVVS